MLLAIAIAGATEIHVPGDQPTLSAAVSAASGLPGPEIVLAPGTHDVTGTVLWFGPGLLRIRSADVAAPAELMCSLTCLEASSGGTLALEDLVVRGGAPAVRVIGALSAVRTRFEGATDRAIDALATQSSVSLQSCDFVGNASNGDGGAVRAYGMLDVAECTFSVNNARGGGAVALSGGSAAATITGSSFDGNGSDQAQGGGAILAPSGVLHVDSSVFVRNTHTYASGAGNGGGAIRSGGAALTVEGSLFCGNTTNRTGGAIHTDNGSVSVEGSLFVRNGRDDLGQTVTYRASAVAVNSPNAAGELRHNTFVENAAIEGSALHLSAGSAHTAVADNLFVDNVAGALYLDRQPALPVVNAYYQNGANETLTNSVSTSPFFDTPAPVTVGDCDAGVLRLRGSAVVGTATDGSTFGAVQDLDGDGWFPPQDCDDADPTVAPGAPEVCGDGLDQDCDGQDNAAVTAFLDGDGDGYGDLAFEVCPGALGYAEQGGDCDDSRADRFPGAPETCDGTDHSCSGDESDASDALPWFVDADGDGHGGGPSLGMACTLPEGASAVGDDCDDDDPDRHPGAHEVCDGVDDDCDGVADDGVQVDVWLDGDGDGFGRGAPSPGCPYEGALEGGDCDDADVTTFPGAPERCDGADNDCDGSAEETTGFLDGDGDGHGAPGALVDDCSGVPDGLDCDDSDADVHPGAAEIAADGIDQDCDGEDDPGPSLGLVCATGPAAPGWLVLPVLFAISRSRRVPSSSRTRRSARPRWPAG
ncbi:MAG: hypothetical protein H6736_07240 [Alphaproteobacteria bacterium]|nr:hypothetical protein [Alphaproteobacteria bacterium]